MTENQASPPQPPRTPPTAVQVDGATVVRADRSRRRAHPALVVITLLSLAIGGYFFWLASQWEDRARTAEDEYRAIENLLVQSESDVTGLSDRQAELAAEKAAAEDAATVLEAQKTQLEELAAELELSNDQVVALAQQLDTIAASYQECANGYQAVISDLLDQTATTRTQAELANAQRACARADALVPTVTEP